MAFQMESSVETALADILEELNDLALDSLTENSDVVKSLLVKVEQRASKLRALLCKDDLDLDDMRTAVSLATPGPWWADSHGHTVVQRDTFETVFATNPKDMEEAKRCEITGNLSHWRNDSDLNFILAFNPKAVGELLDRLEEAERNQCGPKLVYQSVSELLNYERERFHPNVVKVLERAADMEENYNNMKYLLQEMYTPAMKEFLDIKEL